MDIHKVCVRLGVLILLVASVAGPTRAESDSRSSLESDVGSEVQLRVEEDLERFIRARSPGVEAEVEVPLLSGFQFDRSRFTGALRTELSTRAEEPLRGRVPIAVALYAGDELVKRGVVTPNVRVKERVVVPTRDLRPGAVLSRGDLAYVQRDAARIERDVVRELEPLIGLEVKRSLRKDRVFRSSQLQRVSLVERGDRVLLVLDSGPLQIQAMGRAKEKGGYGEWIRVINVDSKRELSGRIDQEGRVHVAF